MTTITDLNEVLNLIKIRIQYFEWKLLMFNNDTDTDTDNREVINSCLESLIEIVRELNCILNFNTLSTKDKTTTIDYLNIIQNIQRIN
jgi:hypothetical protein